MIEVFKMVNDKYDSDLQPPIKLTDSDNIRNTKGNSKKWFMERCQKEVRRNLFRNRGIALWNDLPNKDIEAPSNKSFEKRQDKYWTQFKIKHNFDNCLDYQNQKNKL